MFDKQHMPAEVDAARSLACACLMKLAHGDLPSFTGLALLVPAFSSQ